MSLCAQKTHIALHVCLLSSRLSERSWFCAYVDPQAWSFRVLETDEDLLQSLIMALAAVDF